MKYDFDKIIDRRNTGSVKWDVGENELPMWVADMDFATAPAVTEALVKRASHGVFGYSVIPDEWYDAYINWWERRHGLKMEKDALIFCTGVIAAISSAVRKLTTPNENVVIQTPVYNIFFNSIIKNGCRALENRLVYKDGVYSVDLDDLEKKLSDPQTTLMILCNPHNPIGKIWDAGTLEKIGELCKKHHVTVISDEIHCDITVPGKSYVPFASVSRTCREISVTCVAPTKTFNLAGLQTAAIYVPDEGLRNKVRRAVNTDEVAEPNAFAALAAVAAFEKGEEWLDELNAYLAENRNYVDAFLRENLPQVKLVKGEATYLLWLDISKIGKSSCVARFIREKTGLFVTAGSVYGENGDGFLRMNIACPISLVKDGMKRLSDGIRMFASSREAL